MVNLTTDMLFLFFCICLSKILHLKKHIFVFVILNNEDISNNVAMKTTIQTPLQHPKNIDSKYHEEKNAMNITLELDLKKKLKKMIRSQRSIGNFFVYSSNASNKSQQLYLSVPWTATLGLISNNGKRTEQHKIL